MLRLFPALLLSIGLALSSACVAPRALSSDLELSQREKGFSSSRSTAEALDSTFAPRRIAVVIGINRFGDSAFPDLRWAVKDARAVGDILQDPEYGGFDRVVYLTEEAQVRRDRILTELVSLRNDLRRQDTLVVYASTHGTMTLDKDGEPHLYLVTADSRPGDLRGTSIELSELQRYFSEIRAERKALILDACYNGEAKSTLQPTVRQQVERMSEAPILSRKVRLGESEAHLFASTFGRPAREDDELEHGVYTYHLLDGLTWNQKEADSNSDGVVSIYEAHDHARQKTLSYTTGSQIPEAYFRVVGRNDVVLVGSPEQRMKVDVSAVYFYGSNDEAFDGASLVIDGQEKGSFPGTFVVEPGRHRVRIVAGDGTLLQDRTLLFSSGEAVAADALKARPTYWNGFLSVGPKVRFALGDALRPLVGRAYVGAQASGGYRFLGPVRGLTVHGGLGYAPHQARFEDDARVRFEPRHIVWGHVGVGYRLPLRHGTLGAAYRLRLAGVTALEDPACAGHPACDAWLYAVHGVVLEQTVSLGRRWSLYIEEEVGITALDVDGTGAVPALDAGIQIGVEVGL